MKKPELKTMDYLFRQIALEKWARAGHGRCFTCGKVLVRDRLEVGHYKSRRHRSIRWSLDNARLQCHDCNQAQAGAHGAAKAREVEATYRDRLVAEIGEARVAAVEEAARHPVNIDTLELVELYEKMKEQVSGIE